MSRCPACGRVFRKLPGRSRPVAGYALCVGGGPLDGSAVSFLEGETEIDPRGVTGWVYKIGPAADPLARLANRGATHLARFSAR